jgi:hypothetical protein
MAPVLAGAVKMIELHSGELTLWDIALANDALAVQAENRRRATER